MKEVEIFEQASMNSIEIAELTGSQHKDVKRSIERLMDKGIIRNAALANFEKINNLGLKRNVGCSRCDCSSSN